jgi:hypothetical protein
VYERTPVGKGGEDFEFDLTRPSVNSAKIARVLGYRPAVSREVAMAMTLDWARHARVLSAGSRK